MKWISNRLVLICLLSTASSAFAQEVLNWTIPTAGALSVASTAEPASTRAGYVRVQTSETPTPPAMQFLKVVQNRVLVSEAAVASSIPTRSGRVRAILARSVNTGIAVINPGELNVDVTFSINQSEGTLYGRSGITLAPGQHIAALISERPFSLRAPFDGTITINSSAPVVILATRGRLNERSEFLLSVAPVVDLTVLPDSSALLPEFAEGDGWATEIALINPWDRDAAGNMEFWNRTGIRVDVKPFFVPAGGLQIIDLAMSASTLRTGYIRILPPLLGVSPVAAASISFRRNGVVVSEHTVSAIREGIAFRTLAGSRRTALTVTNTNPRPVSVRLDLLTLAGTSTGLSAATTVSANSQLASFLNEIAGFERMPPNFEGVLVIRSSELTIGAAAFHAMNNERGDFVMSVVPVFSDDEPASANETILPHFVIGGEYSMQFVLLGRPGSSASGVLRFLDQIGNPLSIVLR